MAQAAATPALTLVSHDLCPYVQRAAIVLLEKKQIFERRWIDPANKPEWFRAISPLGKTPVLLVGNTPLFESTVICEYLDDTLTPRLHPADALARAQHRAWMEFGSALLNSIAGFYSAHDQEALEKKRTEIAERLTQLEVELGQRASVGAHGPFFAGGGFSIVDAVFGPIFRYFEVFDQFSNFGWTAGLPRTDAWRRALAARPSVQQAVVPDYAQRLLAFIERKNSALTTVLRARAAAQTADAPAP
ncbi:glutathione S-transferase family protein [Piscinibacterium candidicorallinum]|uniref:glutathione transferase n=1 Tax=Piscinibacterium candidicorallinum TaxID=1793872 RepID=A0ABV7H4E0_9BURK